MRADNSLSKHIPTISVNTTTPDGSRVVWGFMFENTLFTEFERRNHPLIEAAYRQRKKKHTSHHITIVDSNLPKPGKAKVYFGVAQNHLRMPGTRYYVTRQVIKTSTSESSPRPPVTKVIPPTPSTSSPYAMPTIIPSPASTFSTSSFSSVDTSFLYPTSSYNFMQSGQQQQQLNANTLADVLSDDLPLVDLSNNNYSDLSVQSGDLLLNSQHYSNNSHYNNNDMCFADNDNIDSLQTTNYFGNDNFDVVSKNNVAMANKCNCSTVSDFNNTNSILEDPNWVQDFVSLGLLPKFPEQVSWLSAAYDYKCGGVNDFNITANSDTADAMFSTNSHIDSLMKS